MAKPTSNTRPAEASFDSEDKTDLRPGNPPEAATDSLTQTGKADIDQQTGVEEKSS